MRVLMTIAAIAALSACGVDGPPVRPDGDSALARPKNVSPGAGQPGWVAGEVSMHTGTTL